MSKTEKDILYAKNQTFISNSLSNWGKFIDSERADIDVKNRNQFNSFREFIESIYNGAILNVREKREEHASLAILESIDGKGITYWKQLTKEAEDMQGLREYSMDTQKLMEEGKVTVHTPNGDKSFVKLHANWTYLEYISVKGNRLSVSFEQPGEGSEGYVVLGYVDVLFNPVGVEF